MIIHYTTLPAAARTVRTAVFMEEQGYQQEFDDIDARAVHFVAYQGHVPLGTCRLYPSETAGDWRLGRLAVVRAARGRHIGQTLLAAAADYARTRQATGITLSAQLHAVSFYEAAGYHTTGEETLDEGHPHATMHLVLAPSHSSSEK